MNNLDFDFDFDSIESLDDLILHEKLINFRLNQCRDSNYSYAVIWISKDYYAINIPERCKLVDPNKVIMKIDSYYIFDRTYLASIYIDEKHSIINLFHPSNVLVRYNKILNDCYAYYHTYYIPKNPEEFTIYMNKIYYLQSIFEIYKHKINYSLYEYNFVLKHDNNRVYIKDLNLGLSICIYNSSIDSKLVSLDKLEYMKIKALLTNIVINFIDKINNIENLSIKHKIKIMSVMLSLLKFTPLYCNIELNNYFVYECNEL